MDTGVEDVLKARDGSTYKAIKDEATGTWSILDFPIFAVGKWHQREFTAGIVDQFIANTERARKYITPSIGIGHGKEGENRTERPRYGKVGELYRKGEIVFSKALHNIHDKVFQGIKSGALGHPSVGLIKYSNPDTREREVTFGYVDFTGIVPPEVPTLAPATDFGLFGAIEAEAVLSWDDFNPFAAEEAPTGELGQSAPVAPDAQAQKEEQSTMSDEAKAREVTLAAENADLKAKLLAAEKATEDQAKARKEDREKQFSAHVAGKIDDLIQGEWIKKGEEDNVKGALAGIDPHSEKAFSSVDQIVNIWKARGKQKPNTGKPAGKSGDDNDPNKDRMADERMHFAALELCEKRGWDTEDYIMYGKALVEVANGNEKLATEVVAQFSCDAIKEHRTSQEGGE